MNIGDYVRTKRGQLHRITDLKKYYENDVLIEDKQLVHIDNHFSGWDLGQFKELIVKSSPNIIDLIEVGDYVNGYKVLEIEKDYLFDYTEEINVLIVQNGEVYEVAKKIYSDDIKSIVTKEQFESMEYKVGE